MFNTDGRVGSRFDWEQIIADWHSGLSLKQLAEKNASTPGSINQGINRLRASNCYIARKKPGGRGWIDPVPTERIILTKDNFVGKGARAVKYQVKRPLGYTGPNHLRNKLHKTKGLNTNMAASKKSRYEFRYIGTYQIPGEDPEFEKSDWLVSRVAAVEGARALSALKDNEDGTKPFYDEVWIEERQVVFYNPKKLKAEDW